MRKCMIRVLADIICILTFCTSIFCTSIFYASIFCVPAYADSELVIDDGAQLFTDEEEELLRGHWSDLNDSAYMPFAAIVTTDAPGGRTAAFAENYSIRNYGGSSAVIFVIDMKNRQLYIYSNGSALNIFSEADARAVTDNIYRMAVSGDYYACADTALEQISAVFHGEQIARPVKHITNALIAVLLAVLLNCCAVVWSRRPGRHGKDTGYTESTEDTETARGRISRYKSLIPGISVAEPVLISSERHYHSSGSDGGGGGFGSGGGGHSGGGGCHSF